MQNQIGLIGRGFLVREVRVDLTQSVIRVNHLTDDLTRLIHRSGVSADRHDPMLVIVGEKQQVLPTRLQDNRVVPMLAEDRDLARLLAFDLLIDMDHILGAIQRVPRLWYLARRHHGADDHRLRVLHFLGDRQRAGARSVRGCREKKAY